MRLEGRRRGRHVAREHGGGDGACVLRRRQRGRPRPRARRRRRYERYRNRGRRDADDFGEFGADPRARRDTRSARRRRRRRPTRRARRPSRPPTRPRFESTRTCGRERTVRGRFESVLQVYRASASRRCPSSADFTRARGTPPSRARSAPTTRRPRRNRDPDVKTTAHLPRTIPNPKCPSPKCPTPTPSSSRESEMSESEMSESDAAPSSLAVGVTSRTASAERCAPNAATTSSSHGSRAAGSEGGGHANDSGRAKRPPGRNASANVRRRSSPPPPPPRVFARRSRRASGERSAPPPDEDARDAAMTRVAVASFASSFVGSAALARRASTNAASNAGRRHRDAIDPIGASFVNAPFVERVLEFFEDGGERVFARRRLRPAPRARRASRPRLRRRAITTSPTPCAAASVAGSNPASVVFEDRLVSRHLAASARASPPGRHAAPCASTKDAMRVACARSNEDGAVVAANRGAANFAPTQPVDDASETPLAPFLARAAARTASWDRARARGARRVHPRAPVLVASDRRDLAGAALRLEPFAAGAHRIASSVANISHDAIPRRRGRRSGRRVRVTRASASGAHRSVTIVRAALRRNGLHAENVLAASRDDDAVQKPRASRRSAVASARRVTACSTPPTRTNTPLICPQEALDRRTSQKTLSGRTARRTRRRMRERSGGATARGGRVAVAPRREVFDERGDRLGDGVDVGPSWGSGLAWR